MNIYVLLQHSTDPDKTISFVSTQLRRLESVAKTKLYTELGVPAECQDYDTVAVSIPTITAAKRAARAGYELRRGKQKGAHA